VTEEDHRKKPPFAEEATGHHLYPPRGEWQQQSGKHGEMNSKSNIDINKA
jgi:hypothetical protein